MTPVKEFFTAGRAVFTLQVPADFRAEHPEVNAHYTYRINHVPANDRWPEAWFVSLLIGSDNQHAYKSFGKLNPETGAVKLNKTSFLNEASWAYRLVYRALVNVFAGTPERIEEAGFELHHEGRCGRCGRPLTVPESIKSGLGPICASK